MKYCVVIFDVGKRVPLVIRALVAVNGMTVLEASEKLKESPAKLYIRTRSTAENLIKELDSAGALAVLIG